MGPYFNRGPVIGYQIKALRADRPGHWLPREYNCEARSPREIGCGDFIARPCLRMRCVRKHGLAPQTKELRQLACSSEPWPELTSKHRLHVRNRHGAVEIVTPTSGS